MSPIQIDNVVPIIRSTQGTSLHAIFEASFCIPGAKYVTNKSMSQFLAPSFGGQ